MGVTLEGESGGSGMEAWERHAREARCSTRCAACRSAGERSLEAMRESFPSLESGYAAMWLQAVELEKAFRNRGRARSHEAHLCRSLAAADSY